MGFLIYTTYPTPSYVLVKNYFNNMKNIKNKEEYNRIAELRNIVYNAEDMIDGQYSIGMYGDKYKEIDELHTKVLELLNKYDDLLGEALK